MTATITEEDVDTDQVHALDFQYAPQCEATDENDNRCENKADFILAKKCCGTNFLVCEDCYYAWIQSVKDGPMVAVCEECGHVFKKNEDPMMFLRRIT